MYKPRIVDSELRERLASAKVVVIEGPKACGKTLSAREVAASEVLLDVDANARRAAALTPGVVLAGDVPRLIDEWQLVPEIWNHVRREADERDSPGQFLLTGSAIPAEEKLRHSGAGRIGRLRMRPMSLHELDRSSGDVSLGLLLQNHDPGGSRSEVTVEHVSELVAVGGWPGSLGLSPARAIRTNRDYIAEISRTDIQTIDGVRRDPTKVERLLRSLARNTATEVGISKLALDAAGGEKELYRGTVDEYLSALRRLYVVDDQPAWGPHLRSRARVRQGPKRHFVDPSLAVAALHASPGDLLNDLEFLGLLFESMVIRDLRIYAQAGDARVLHYRDHDGLEVDAIVEAGTDRWAAFEVKLGGTELIEEGANNLLSFRDKVDTTRCGKPTALGVIAAVEYGYTREDGVLVIPIGSLGP